MTVLTRWWLKDDDPVASGTTELILIRASLPRSTARWGAGVAVVLFCLAAFAVLVLLVRGIPDGPEPAPTPAPVTLVVRPAER